MIKTNFKPLLAATPESAADLRFPMLASPKLDGIRCIKLDGRALSRHLKPIPNDFVRTWIEANVPDGFDGELMLADPSAPFNEITSAIMSKKGEPDFRYHVFDFATDATVNLQYKDRLQILESIAGRMQVGIVLVPQRLVEDQASLVRVMENDLLNGYEGTMVRSPAGRYKYGRSTVREGLLLKLKPFIDEDATVVGVVEMMRNENEATIDELGHTKRSTAKAGKVGAGRLGALQCVTSDGVRFDLGTGFTDEQRVRLWREVEMDQFDYGDSDSSTRGRVVKFKHQPPPGGRRPGEAPRFPVFISFRED